MGTTMQKIIARSLSAALLTMLFTIISITGFAQFDKGQVAGFVRDSGGAVVPNATVRITNISTKLDRVATSDDTGYYIITNLQPGDYEVIVEARGFKKFAHPRFRLDGSAKVTIDATLEAGELTETVTVTATVTEIQRDTAQVGRTVEREDITELALNGRNPINLAMLKAGVRGGLFNSFQPDSLTTGGFSINGSRSDENLITIDGVVSTRTRSSGAIVGTLNVDTVQELKVLTSNYLPEYGRASGGQLRFVTRGGGRDFHADIFEFFRNSALDANSWARNATVRNNNPLFKDVAVSPAPVRFNQFGFNLNGPIYLPEKFFGPLGGWNKNRDRLFFFWSEEWIRYRREETNFGTVPSARMREGDFSELLSPTNLWFGGARYIRDPLKAGTCSAADQTACFAGNIIPQNRLSPNGQALLRVYPLPTPNFVRGNQNWFTVSPNPRNTRKDTLRIDFHANEKNLISFRGSNFDWKAVDAFRGTFDIARTDWSRPNRTAALSWTYTITPTLINEFTFGSAADLVYINVFDNGKYQRSQYGLNYPYIFPEGKEIADKIPTIAVANLSTIDGGPYPAFSSGPIYTWSNNLTKIAGRHTIKGGIFIEYSGENDFDQINVQNLPGDTNNQNGGFQFTNSTGRTTLAMSDVALGQFNSYGEIGQKAYTPWRGLGIDLFIQDSWKARDNLTIEFGTRYVYWPPWYSLWNNIAEFNPNFYDPSKAAVIDRATGAIVSGDRFNGIVLPGSGFPSEATANRVPASTNPEYQRLFHNLPRGFSNTHKNVFEPRVGIAYSINQRTVIRLGAGIFHNRVTLNDSTLLGGNPPIQFKVGVSNGSADAPTGTTRRDFPFILTMQDLDFKHPTSYNYSLTIQRELPFNISAEVAYVGRVGAYLQRERNINQLREGTRFLPENAGANTDFLRPYRGLGIIRLSENAGHSNYNGLQVSIDRRFRKGFSFGMAYTFSKNISNADDKRNILFNTYDDRGYKAISDLDRTHVFNVHYIFELPFYRDQRGFIGQVLGGWQVSGITFFQSGSLFWISRGDDVAGVGDSNAQPYNLVGDPKANANKNFSIGAAFDQNFWFNPAAFARPPNGKFGNSGRNILRGPKVQSWDIALFKNFKVKERAKIQFRAEAFNFPNHPYWNNPGTDPTNTNTFGRVLGKTLERNLQFGLRLSF